MENKKVAFREEQKPKKIEKTPKLYDGIGNVNWRNLYVLPDGQGFGKKISQVERTFDEGYDELLLSDAIPNPVEAHVDAL